MKFCSPRQPRVDDDREDGDAEHPAQPFQRGRDDVEDAPGSAPQPRLCPQPEHRDERDHDHHRRRPGEQPGRDRQVGAADDAVRGRRRRGSSEASERRQARQATGGRARRRASLSCFTSTSPQRIPGFLESACMNVGEAGAVPIWLRSAAGVGFFVDHDEVARFDHSLVDGEVDRAGRFALARWPSGRATRRPCSMTMFLRCCRRRRGRAGARRGGCWVPGP